MSFLLSKECAVRKIPRRNLNMGTMELVILSSSPPKPCKYDSTHLRTLSSSPGGLPSPNALILQTQGLQRLRMPTQSTVALFGTSASSLLRPKAITEAITEALQSDSIWDFPEETIAPVEVEQSEMPKAKPPIKSRAKQAAAPKDGTETSQAAPKKPRNSRAKKVDNEEGGRPVAEGTSKEKTIRKPRAKKAATNGQTKIPKGRVTKVSTDPKPKSDGPEDGTVNAQFTNFSNASDFIDIDDIAKDKNLNLHEATKRRTDWTPPKATAEGFLVTTRPGEVVNLDTPPRGFTDLMGSFGYSKAEEPPAYLKESDPIPPRKRKLIEFAKTNTTAAPPQLAPKAKAAKKKPMTITERATAAYALDNEDGSEPAPLLQYLSQDPFIDVGVKPRTRSPAKKSSKANKAAPQPSALLNPQAALEQANRQEFVFGTSSQLARDDDPIPLGDHQRAVQLPRQSMDPFAENSPIARKPRKAKPTMWEAALMIEEEGATEVEVLDLISSSQVEKQLQRSEPVSLLSPPIGISDIPTQQNLSTPIPVASNTPILEKPLLQQQNPIISKPITVTELPKSGQCPNFESYSTAELAKELASYKFKPIKKRDQMIALLEKCWEGKNRAALGSLGVNTIISKANNEPTSPQRKQKQATASSKSPMPRVRQRKNSRATSPSSKGRPDETAVQSTNPHGGGSLSSDKEISISRLTPKKRRKKMTTLPEEISDSDNPLTPSPPRRRASLIRTPPSLRLTTDDINDITIPPLSPNSAETELFAHITKAVIAAPRGTAQAPSWHEKILMYDPIVLEDLTRWLNTSGLDAVGYDGEAKAVDVKAWCRARSVCCLWKLSSRKGGGVKKVGQEV